MIQILRSLSVLFLLTLVAACTTPMLQEGTPQTFVVRTISVDVSAFQGVTGREIEVPKRQIADDIKTALKATLARPGASNADLSVTLKTVRLTSPARAAAFGGNSRIIALLQVVDSVTGAILIPSTEITGFSETTRIPGVLGAATSPSAANDYVQTVDGFAASVRNQLYGVPTAS